MNTIRASRLASVPLLAALPPDRLEHLASRCRARMFARDTRILHAGNSSGIFLLERGRVALTAMSPTGRRAIVAVPSRNEPIGVECLLGRPIAHDLIALQRGIGIIIPVSDLHPWLVRDPAFGRQVAMHFADHATRVERALQDVLLLDAAGRVASRLCDLADRHGFHADGGAALPSPPRHDHLAALTGVSRETVSRILATFRRQGLLSSRPGVAIIHDVAALRALAHV